MFSPIPYTTPSPKLSGPRTAKTIGCSDLQLSLARKQASASLRSSADPPMCGVTLQCASCRTISGRGVWTRHIVPSSMSERVDHPPRSGQGRGVCAAEVPALEAHLRSRHFFRLARDQHHHLGIRLHK
jgi:hypothetical protein